MTNTCLPLAQMNRDSSNVKDLSLGASTRASLVIGGTPAKSPSLKECGLGF